MAVKPAILLLTLVTILVEGEVPKVYLPKDPGYLPMSDLYARGIARSGWDSFYKVNKQEYAALISAAPVRPNSVTKVTIYLEKGNAMYFGCGPKLETKMIEMGDLCWMPHIVSYWPPRGGKTKYKIRDSTCEQISYGSPGYQGDNITMIIDMRPFQWSLSFAKNGIPMGIAFAGLNQFEDIYIYMTLVRPNDRLKIIDYQVTE